MQPVVASEVGRRPSRSRRPSGAGVVLVVCSLLLALTLPLLTVPAGPVLVAVIGTAGAVLLIKVPRSGSVAPAAALGAAVPLVTAAVTSGHLVAGTVAVGAGLAVVGVTVWRLERRREWAPWDGTRGVLVTATTAVACLGIGGVVAVDAMQTVGTTVWDALAGLAATAVPWSLLIGACGWLRHPVAAALVLPSLVQLAVVVW